jgi:hypothetical protein
MLLPKKKEEEESLCVDGDAFFGKRRSNNEKEFVHARELPPYHVGVDTINLPVAK